MDWSILGIDPTKDKKVITAAYRARLKQTNPEDKPEEFKALRAAYEEAIRLADREEEDPEQDDSPVGLWKARLAALYGDFQARIQPGNWEALINDDVCIGLDTRPQAEEALLQFLLEHYFLPQAVWQVLDQAFAFSAREEELCEIVPREFVEQAVLNGIRFAPGLPYALFDPGENAGDCDTYRRLYHQACQLPTAEWGNILEQLEALSEYHPYGQALRYRWQMENGQREAGAEGFRILAKTYPADPVLNMDWAAVCLEDGNGQEAERIVRRILSELPNHMQAKQTLAECLAAKGQIQEAKELTFEVMQAGGDDPILMDQCAQRLRGWNEALMIQREAAMARDPADTGNAIELAWCYIQNDRPEDAMDLARKIDPAHAEPFAYHNLMGKLYHNLQMFAQALPHLETVEEILRKMIPDGTEETAKRLSRLPEMLQVQGNCLMQLGENDRAREKFEQALELAPEDPKVLTIMGQILFSSGDYEACAEIQERLIRVSPGSWFGNVILSLALQKLNRDREAFDAVNRALAVQGGDLSLYVIKMQILLRNEIFEEVHATLDFLRDVGAPADISTDWIKAQLTELEEKNEEKAFRQYQAIARQVENGGEMMYISQLYYRMAMLMSKQADASKEEDREILLAVLEKGLANDKFDEDCLSFKAWLLQKGGKLEEAIAMYRGLNTTAAEMKLAELYYSDLERYAAEALACYESLLQKRQSAELCFYAATCKRQMGDYEGARQYYERELELDPMDVDGYHGLAYVLEAQGRYDDALKQLDQAITVMYETENAFPWLIDHRVQVLRRMGRHQQALAAVDEAMSRLDYPAGYQTRFDICCQFGLWEQAGQVLDQWQKARRNDPDRIAAAARLHLLTGKLFKAVLTMGKGKHGMDYEQQQDFRLQLAELECNHKRQIQIWGRRAAQDPDSDHALMSLALAYWWSGDRDAAKQTARKALNLIDDILERNLVDEALFRSRRSVLLALLGRIEDARAELVLVRKLPLCQLCAYGRCKDADIFEGYIEEISGNMEQARACYRAGRQNWPDELDFASGEARLKKRGM